MKSAMQHLTWQNNGFVELNYQQILALSPNLSISRPIIDRASSFVPRIVPRNFLPEINAFSQLNDNLLYSIVVEQPLWNPEGHKMVRKYFWNPSMTLFATLMRSTFREIAEILGWNDPISNTDKLKIKKIMHLLDKARQLSETRKRISAENPSLSKFQKLQKLKDLLPFRYIERKRLSSLFTPKLVQKIRYDGQAFNAIVPSKMDSSRFYECQYKQLISFDREVLHLNPANQARCDCGFNKSSFVKYEYNNIIAHCHHLELLRQTLANPSIGKNVEIYDTTRQRTRFSIPKIFSPFSPLDYPKLHTPQLRTILREGLSLFLIPQPFISECFDDESQFHKRNGYTLFRCELDCFLLSFQEIFDADFFFLWQKYYNESQSLEYTAHYFGDCKKQGYRKVDAQHFYNSHRDCLEHRVDRRFIQIKHYARELATGRIGPLLPHQYGHSPLHYDHFFYDTNLNFRDYEIFHVQEIWESYQDCFKPFQVACLPNGLRIYIHPYKMKKHDKKFRHTPESL